MSPKKNKWYLASFALLLMISLMVSGCQARTPTSTQPPIDTDKLGDNAHQNQGSPADQSNFKKYTEPEAYTIKYPDGWTLQGGGQKTGFEILALYKADPEAKNQGPHGGQDPNSAKIAVSIDTKNGRTFEEAVEDYYLNNDLDNKVDQSKEQLSLNGTQAVRFYYTHDDPIISLIIDIDQDRYGIITGYHGGGSEKDKLIEEIKLIQESFQP